MGSLQVIFLFLLYIHFLGSITPHVKGLHTYEILSSCSAVNYHEKHVLFLSYYSIIFKHAMAGNSAHSQ